jgi:hypothetical protein
LTNIKAANQIGVNLHLDIRTLVLIE